MEFINDFLVVISIIMCVAGLIVGCRGAHRIATYRAKRKENKDELESLGKRFLIIGDIEFVVGFSLFAAGIYFIVSYFH